MITAIDKLKDDLSDLIELWRQSPGRRDNSYDAGRDDAFSEAASIMTEMLKQHVPKLACELHDAKDGKVEWEAKALQAVRRELLVLSGSSNANDRFIAHRLEHVIEKIERQKA